MLPVRLVIIPPPHESHPRKEGEPGPRPRRPSWGALTSHDSAAFLARGFLGGGAWFPVFSDLRKCRIAQARPTSFQQQTNPAHPSLLKGLVDAGQGR